MHYIKLPVLFILLFTSGISQAQLRQKAYQPGSVNDIIPIPGGGFMLTGSMRTPGTEKCYMMKFDAMNNPAWVRSYTDAQEFYSYGNKIINLPGVGYLIAGVMFHDTLSNEEITLHKCALDGSLLWSKEYGNPFDDDEVESMITIPGGILLVGHCTDFGIGGEDFYLLKTDSSGVLNMTKTYGTARNERGISILPYQNGYVFGGYGQEASGSNNDLFLVYLDSNFDITNTVRFIMAGNQKLYDMIVDNADNIIIAATNDSAANYSKSLIIKVPSFGPISWCKEIADEYSIPHKILEVPGGYLIGGETKKVLGNENGFLVQLDVNGNISTENYFGDSTGFIFKSFIITNDSLLIGGDYINHGLFSPSIYLNNYIPTDSICNHYLRTSTLLDLNPTIIIPTWQTASPATVELNSSVLGPNTSWSDSIVCDVNPSVSELENQYPIYFSPNPSSGNVILTIPFDYREATVSIISSKGNLLKKKIVNQKNNLISVSDLSSGIYTVQIVFKEFTLTKRLIVQH